MGWIIRGGKRGENRVWICWRQLWAHTAGEIEPSADVQASHCSLILPLKLEGGSVILQPDTLRCCFSWPDLQELFYFGTRTGKAASALEKQLQRCCCGGELGARPSVGSLGWNTFQMLLSLLPQYIYLFQMPWIPFSGKYFNAGSSFLNVIWEIFFSKTSRNTKAQNKTCFVTITSPPNKTKQKSPASQANQNLKLWDYLNFQSYLGKNKKDSASLCPKI